MSLRLVVDNSARVLEFEPPRGSSRTAVVTISRVNNSIRGGASTSISTAKDWRLAVNTTGVAPDQEIAKSVHTAILRVRTELFRPKERLSQTLVTVTGQWTHAKRPICAESSEKTRIVSPAAKPEEVEETAQWVRARLLKILISPGGDCGSCKCDRGVA